MAKTIRFTFNDIDYTLEYTKRTIKQMEANGFDINEIDSKQMTMLEMMFAGSFLAHHRFTKVDTINEIYKAMPSKEELLEALSEMYREQIDSLLEEPDENVTKKVEWSKDF